MANQVAHENLPPLLKRFDTEVLETMSFKSRKTYLSKLILFFKWINAKNINPENINRKIVASFIKDSKSEGNKPRTLENKLATIRKLAQWLWEEDLLTSKELQKIHSMKIKIPKGEQSYRALSEEEIALGFQKISHPTLRVIFWAGINYGFRNQEYCELEKKHVDLENDRLTVFNSKGNKTRRIPITPKQKRIWKDWFQQREILYRPKHEFVFLTSRGSLTKWQLERYYNKIAKTIYPSIPEKHFTSHDLRKTYATRLWRNGVDILVISKMLGHEKLSTTQGYLAITEEELHERYLLQTANFM